MPNDDSNGTIQAMANYCKRRCPILGAWSLKSCTPATIVGGTKEIGGPKEVTLFWKEVLLKTKIDLEMKIGET